MYPSGGIIVVLSFFKCFDVLWIFCLCLFCVCVCVSVCLHVCLQGHAMLEKARRGRQIPRTGVTDTCKPPCGRWELNWASLQEQRRLIHLSSPWLYTLYCWEVCTLDSDCIGVGAGEGRTQPLSLRRSTLHLPYISTAQETQAPKNVYYVLQECKFIVWLKKSKPQKPL